MSTDHTARADHSPSRHPIDGGRLRRSAATRAVAAIAVTLTALVSLTACGSGTSTSAGLVTATTPLDPAAAAEQDAAFATAMFDHRHRTLQLLGLVAQYGENSDVVTFAGTLQTSYDNQMRDLEGLLTSWDKPVPHVEGHSDLGNEIPGVLTAPELAKLRAAKPAEFEKQFLTVLAAHERSVTAAAQKELRLGADPRATAYAKDVVQETTTHLADIDAMLQKRP